MQSKNRDRPAGHTEVNEVFGRLRQVETDVASIRADMSAITANQVSQSNMLSHIADTVDKRGATDWKALAAWTAVLLALVGMFTAQNFTPLKEQQEQLAQSVRQLQQADAVEMNAALAEATTRGRYLERVDEMKRRHDALLERALQQGDRR